MEPLTKTYKGKDVTKWDQEVEANRERDKLQSYSLSLVFNQKI